MNSTSTTSTSSMRELVQNVLMNQKLHQGKLKEFAMSWPTDESWSKKKLNEFVLSSLMYQKSERKKLDKFAKNLLMNRNGNHEQLQMMLDDGAADQCVNRSKKPQMVIQHKLRTKLEHRRN